MTAPRTRTQRAQAYLDAVVDGTAPDERSTAFLQHVAPTVDMLRRTTPMKLFWARDYSDYHPELPGRQRSRAHVRVPAVEHVDARRVPAATASRRHGGDDPHADHRARTTAGSTWCRGYRARACRIIAKRLGQGVGWTAAGPSLRRGRTGAGRRTVRRCACAPASPCGRIRLWSVITDDGAESPAPSSSHEGNEFTITARRGVVLAAGGFDHTWTCAGSSNPNPSASNQSLGAETNTGDAIRLAQDVGAAIDLMDQSWWFPAVAPLPGKAIRR